MYPAKPRGYEREKFTEILLKKFQLTQNSYKCLQYKKTHILYLEKSQS